MNTMNELTLDRASAVPLYEQLHDIIRHWIDTGHIKENGQLPSDLELAEQFQVSRITVRKAFTLLVEEGIVVRKSGKGTFVSPSKISYTADSTTSFSKLMREYGQETFNRILELRVCEPEEEIRQMLQMERGEQVIFLSRLRFANGIPMALHNDYFPYSRFYPIMGADFVNGSIGDILAQMNVFVHRTNDVLSVHVSDKNFNNIFQFDRPTAIMEIYGAAYDEEDRPIRFTKGFFRGDYFNFQFDASKMFIFKEQQNENRTTEQE